MSKERPAGSRQAEPAILAIDLGGTRLRVAAANAEGEIIASRRVPSPATEGPVAVLDAILQLSESLGFDVSTRFSNGSTVHTTDSPALRIGVSAPGPLDPVSGTVDRLPNLRGWSGFALRDALAERFQIEPTQASIAIHNDANMAAWGEFKQGAAAGLNCTSMIYLTLSTGIGGGIILDGKLVLGHRAQAAEIGHILMRDDAKVPACGLGHIACLEALASGSGIAARARAALEGRPDDILVGRDTSGLAMIESAAANRSAEAEAGSRPAAQAPKSRSGWDSSDLARLARAGDPLASRLFEDAAACIGRALASLTSVLDPEIFVLGGGLTNAWDLLEEGIESGMIEGLVGPRFGRPKILRATLADDAGLIGAARFVALAKHE